MIVLATLCFIGFLWSADRFADKDIINPPANPFWVIFFAIMFFVFIILKATV